MRLESVMRPSPLPLLVGMALTIATGASAQIAPGPLPQPTSPLPLAPLPISPTPIAPEPLIISEPAPQPIVREPIPATQFQLTLPGAAPTDVQATATGPRAIRVSWTAPADAESYRLYRQSGADTAYYPIGSSATGTSSDDGGLLPGTAYRYKVAAYYPSVMQRRPGLSTAAGTVTAPAPVPTGLTAANGGRYRVNLSWRPLVEANAYRLYRDGRLLTEIRPMQVEPTRSVLPSSYADSLPAGPHQYQIQAVFRMDAAETTSPIVPTPPVGVAVAAWFCTAGAP
jgi:hypothetical protein